MHITIASITFDLDRPGVILGFLLLLFIAGGVCWIGFALLRHRHFDPNVDPNGVRPIGSIDDQFQGGLGLGTSTSYLSASTLESIGRGSDVELRRAGKAGSREDFKEG